MRDKEAGVYVETILGAKCSIEADARTGRFSCDVAGHSYTAKDRDELIAQLRKAVKKTKVKISEPLTLLNVKRRRVTPSHGPAYDVWDPGVGLQHVICVGRHARTGALLLTDDDGNRLDMGRYRNRRDEMTRRLNAKQIYEYTTLATEFHRAEKAFDTFKETHVIDDVDEHVQSLVDAAALEAGIDEPDDDADPRTTTTRSNLKRRAIIEG